MTSAVRVAFDVDEAVKDVVVVFDGVVGLVVVIGLDSVVVVAFSVVWSNFAANT